VKVTQPARRPFRPARRRYSPTTAAESTAIAKRNPDSVSSFHRLTLFYSIFQEIADAPLLMLMLIAD